jgi:hypothetical protein
LLTWLAGFAGSAFALWQGGLGAPQSVPLPISGFILALAVIEAGVAGLYFAYIGRGIPYPVYLAVLILVFFFNPAVCALGAYYLAELARGIARGGGGLAGGALELAPGHAAGPPALAAMLLLAPLLLVLLAWKEQGRALVVKKFTIPTPYPAEPLTLVFASDFHLGNYFPQKRLHAILAAIAASDPDYVLLGGDLIEYHHKELDACGWFLSELAARGNVLAVIGNHDYFGNADIVEAKLRAYGFTVLRDAIFTLKNGVPLLGARDFLWEGSVHRSFADLPDGKPALLLSHNPDLALHLNAGDRSKVFAAISGHTHGGQICLPGIGAVFMPGDRRFAPGWNRVGSNPLPVLLSAGAGHTGLPARLNCPPDILVIELRGQGTDGDTR